MNKTKCLFVSHVPIYSLLGGGAGNSLSIFLQHQAFLEVDLLFPLFIGHLFQLPKIIIQAYKLKPPSIRRIYFLPLPWSSCFEGRQTSFKANAAYFLNNIIAFLLMPVTKKIIRKPCYQFVHFNSLVLHQLISDKSKQTLHVREIIDRKHAQLKKVATNLGKAAGLVFIDQATLDSFQKCAIPGTMPCNRVINNPFDMSKARRLRTKKQYIFKELGLGDLTGKVFAYIGNIHPVKGVDLIIKAFNDASPPDSKLFIIGAGNNQYVDFCRSLAIKENVVFMGVLEFQDMQKIYAVTDYVLRGDPDFRIGRTIYEALYAGGNAIIPGTQKDLIKEPKLMSFVSNIIFYHPSDVDSLSKAIHEADISGTSISANSFETGNIEQHCIQMEKFFRSCIVNQCNKTTGSPNKAGSL